MKLSKIKEQLTNSGKDRASVTLFPNRKKGGYTARFCIGGTRVTKYYTSIEQDIEMSEHTPIGGGEDVKNTRYFYTDWDRIGNGAFAPRECYYGIEEKYKPIVALKHIIKKGGHEYLPMSAYD